MENQPTNNQSEPKGKTVKAFFGKTEVNMPIETAKKVLRLQKLIKEQQAQKEPQPTKGAQLDQLLKQGETLHQQMRDLFLKNGLETMDIKALPEADRLEWQRLRAESDLLANKVTQTING